MILETGIHQDVAKLARQHMVGRFLPMLTSVFERHARRGVLRPGSARARAQAFIGMMVIQALLRPAFEDLLEPDLDATIAEYVQIMVRGVLAAPEGAAPLKALDRLLAQGDAVCPQSPAVGAGQAAGAVRAEDHGVAPAGQGEGQCRPAMPLAVGGERPAARLPAVAVGAVKHAAPHNVPETVEARTSLRPSARPSPTSASK